MESTLGCILEIHNKIRCTRKTVYAKKRYKLKEILNFRE